MSLSEQVAIQILPKLGELGRNEGWCLFPTSYSLTYVGSSHLRFQQGKQFKIRKGISLRAINGHGDTLKVVNAICC